MTQLNNEQKQLLFDYCLGLTAENETAEAQALIASNEQAAEIHSKLNANLAPLQNIEPESCPDELVNRTILRLNNAARSSQRNLEQLLAKEQAKGEFVKTGLWFNLGKVVAAAAVILFVAGVFSTSTNFARQKSSQKGCEMNLAQIARGVNQYRDDHEGSLPTVATTTGAPWWMVGKQGNENQSNTRHIWLLVKGNYVNPSEFLCPGRRQIRVLPVQPSQIEYYSDFPAREHINYSLRIRCRKPENPNLNGRQVLMADMNPIFEKLPQNYSEPFKVEVNKDLQISNSINHNRRGQNVLFCDGSVKFVRTRHIDISEDDIFTLKDTRIYKGCEEPSCETDAFLAP